MAISKIESKSTGTPVNLKQIKGFLVSPPGSPSVGDRYIVDVGGTGAWVGLDNYIVEYNNGGRWTAIIPKEGFTVRDNVADVSYIYTSGSWEIYLDLTGSFITVLAGEGLIPGGSSGTMAVNVDGTTIVIDSDALQIADSVFVRFSSGPIDTSTVTADSFDFSAYGATAVTWDYSVGDGTNFRAGRVQAQWDSVAASVEYYEVATIDIGDTTPVTIAVDASAGDIRLRVTTASNGWTIKGNRSLII